MPKNNYETNCDDDNIKINPQVETQLVSFIPTSQLVMILLMYVVLILAAGVDYEYDTYSNKRKFSFQLVLSGTTYLTDFGNSLVSILVGFKVLQKHR